MTPRLIILTGASGSGKTTLARVVQQQRLPGCQVVFFDSIGLPSDEEMRALGDGHQPGGAWQRATTRLWMERIAAMLEAGTSVLFEGQMRIAFIHEALAVSGIHHAHLILVDCDDVTRAARLHTDRVTADGQGGLTRPSLARRPSGDQAYHWRSRGTHSSPIFS